MKKYILNSNYILQTVGDETVLLPCGTDNEVDLSKMIVLNETGTLMITCMENDYVSFEKLVDIMEKTYELTSDDYKNDLADFLEELSSKGIICAEEE